MKKRLMVVVMAGTLLAASCSSFDREGSIKELTDGGFEREAAECIVDGIVDEFGEDRATSDDDPTPAEQEKIGEITAGCVTG